MQNPARYTLIRRILFPYNGEEPLSRAQGLRVILTWALLIPLFMSLCPLAVSIVLSLSLQKTLLFLLWAFLSGVFIFGLLALIVVSMSNRAAHIRQERIIRRVEQ
jgi:RsiW-degrading membrane proteinase PrsW (M82 family)